MTIEDLEFFRNRDDGKRYELIDGELFVSPSPHFNHQRICAVLIAMLENWSRARKAGKAAVGTDTVLSEDSAVIPDVLWISNERLDRILGEDGKLHAAPELVVEVLSYGNRNEFRDRHAKLNIYARHGAREYWIVDWNQREITVHRRETGVLRVVATLMEGDTLQSPLLPEFSLDITELFNELS